MHCKWTGHDGLDKAGQWENVTTHELLEEAMRSKAIEHRAEGYRQARQDYNK